MSSHLSHPKYRADIDGLRALAILSVVGYHAFSNRVPGGFIGVDIFFVISGFLISTILFENLEEDSFSFLTFYLRRIRRLFPALMIVFAASFVLGWLMLLPDEYAQLGRYMAGGAGFVSNFILLHHGGGYFDGTGDTKPLMHLWSLGVEEQFYIVWPLLLWGVWKTGFSPLPSILVIAAVSFGLNLYETSHDATAAFYSPQTRFWELLTGALLAYGMLRKQRLLNNVWLSNGTSFMGLLLIAASLHTISKDVAFPGACALMPVLGAVCLIAAGPQAWLNRVVLSHPVTVWFGLISYPLYLWHWPLLAFAHPLESEVPSATGLRAAVALLSIGMAWLTYQLVEKPLRFGGHGRAKALLLILPVCALGAAGYYTYRHDGLELRLPTDLRKLVDNTTYPTIWREGTCFLDPDQDYTAFSKCDTPEVKGRKSVLLWGDSFAAALYPGYQQNFGNEYNIVQRTSGRCPPFLMLNADVQRCKDINNFVFDYARKHLPDTVVLSSKWELIDWMFVKETVRRLKEIGIKNIDLVGPAPAWNDKLPKELYLFYRLHGGAIPYRMNFGLNPDFTLTDARMAEYAKQENINYISPRSILCNEEGCITRAGNTFTTWDQGHLTGPASQYLVSKFPAPAPK